MGSYGEGKIKIGNIQQKEIVHLSNICTFLAKFYLTFIGFTNYLLMSLHLSIYTYIFLYVCLYVYGWVMYMYIHLYIQTFLKMLTLYVSCTNMHTHKGIHQNIVF